MNSTAKGYICGIIAASCYGLSPFYGVSLMNLGMNAASALFNRFALAAIILLILMILQKKPLNISLKEFKVTAILGFLFAASTLTYFIAFHYMSAGIAATILFIYPVMVAVIMAIFFKEKITLLTILSITLSFAGIAMLYFGDNSGQVNTAGVILVLISALTYALYIIVINRSGIVMSAEKMTFYVLLSCIATIFIYTLFDSGSSLMPPQSFPMWGYCLMLALIPTIISLNLMTIAVESVGSTPTAVMGALEPLTAVIIGCLVMHESMTLHLFIGIVLILISVGLIIVGKTFKKHSIKIIVDEVEKEIIRHWRWKL